MLYEKKIDKFDNEEISSLIDCNEEAFNIMKQRPKIIKEGTKSIRQAVINDIIKNNKDLCLDAILNDE